MNAPSAVKPCPLWIFVRQHGRRDVSGLHILRASGLVFSAWPGGDVRWARPGDGESHLVLYAEGWLDILERDAHLQLVSEGVSRLRDDIQALLSEVVYS